MNSGNLGKWMWSHFGGLGYGPRWLEDDPWGGWVCRGRLGLGTHRAGWAKWGQAWVRGGHEVGRLEGLDRVSGFLQRELGRVFGDGPRE